MRRAFKRGGGSNHNAVPRALARMQQKPAAEPHPALLEKPLFIYPLITPAGSLPVNLSTTHINLASAVEWSNYNVLPSDSLAALTVYEANLDAADPLMSSTRRLQQSTVGVLQTAQQVGGAVHSSGMTCVSAAEQLRG